MSNPTSVLEDLLHVSPDLRPQIYFKSSLTALSHAMEDQVLAGRDAPLVIASFQRERFYRQEAHRYLRIAERTSQVYVLAAPEADFSNRSGDYETIAFEPTDGLAHEWHLVVVGARYAACLICRERPPLDKKQSSTDAEVPTPPDQARRFEGIWTFERPIVCQAAELLLDRIVGYRPEIADKVAQAKAQLVGETQTGFNNVDPGPFTERLVTYLQAGQYKLLKAYRSIAAQERKERLVNSITSTIRRSLKPDEIFNVAVQELGQALRVCRCLLYHCKATDAHVTIEHEYRASEVESLMGQSWNLRDNPLFQAAVQRQEQVYVEDAQVDPWLLDNGLELPAARSSVERWKIASWLMVPIVHQNRLLGMVELHNCGVTLHEWTPAELELVEAIATQIGVALIQAEAYANLEDLNQQLEALDLTRSNLIAITGHELRTPLSTIQVCLESLASEPDMPEELRQIMMQSALEDAERMRKLVQDFLTLSELESGRVKWHLEPLPLRECVDLALSSVRARQLHSPLPHISDHVPLELPLVQTDGEWLVEVLSKLLDNACKFTEPKGQVTIEAHSNGGRMLEVTVADTGRGIEPDRLEAVFDRFYQEEGALRRSAGGTGLGLAICRQIVTGLGGKIWAESDGKDRGSQFHFTVPISHNGREEPAPKKTRERSPKPNGASSLRLHG
ncbi:GAF domain-containing protein [Leptolyngbya sp. FACHB-36]|uniref:DICT sensory domain-containing protein n=1 Tax=Leptolyngbya sp. FACHB-36 TaxID=2692808 RepID=UPI0016818D2D|nr:DICT sensory domain-containing protein [Leptolyngbya sp. FACHB-36]MBD2021035.1 GAF domain-containing protein [Leptolyngbya sp. FACHB-36]